MERLTYRGTPTMTEDGMITPSYSDYPIRRIIERLSEYEDAEEQGLLLRFPCKEGAEVYEVRETISGTHKRMGTVQRFEIINGNILVTTTIGMFNAREFGKTVFLAESEGAE